MLFGLLLVRELSLCHAGRLLLPPSFHATLFQWCNFSIDSTKTSTPTSFCPSFLLRLQRLLFVINLLMIIKRYVSLFRLFSESRLVFSPVFLLWLPCFHNLILIIATARCRQLIVHFNSSQRIFQTTWSRLVPFTIGRWLDGTIPMLIISKINMRGL